VSDPGTILRIAAKGDGVTADGRFRALAAPGDVLQDDGSLALGQHHVDPPCRHFGTCGGCQLQHCDDDALARFVFDRVANAAAGQGLPTDVIAPAHLSPPSSRRRATLHAQVGGKVVLGFREGGSHRLVDLAECPVLAPELVALIAPLRKLLARQGAKRIAPECELSLCDQGVDLAIKGLSVEGLPATEAMLAFAQTTGIARLVLDQGYGPEALWEPEPVTVTLSGVPVSLPSGAFVQATADGEAALAGAARQWLAGASTVADLFSGLGTFAFALAGPGTKVLAAEAARDTHLACKGAAARHGRPVHALHRDLFRNPLQVDELDRFAAVVLDPPRAGAREQIGHLAASRVPRVVYVSCNPSSWARDAATLVAGGYRLAEVRPVGQFRWSTHVELASLLVRD
jgi:23S rRNA (uracil1939-C5)-methyltransferase